MKVHEKSSRHQIFQFRQITKYSYKKQVKETIKNQISTTSNQEEWNKIRKTLNESAEKNLCYNHKKKTNRDPNFLHFH